MRTLAPFLMAGVLAVPTAALPAQAAPSAPFSSTEPNQPQPPASPSPEAQEAAKRLWQRSNLLGDIGGLRTLLGRYGISFNLSETSEVLGNPTGGVKQGAIYEGLTNMSLSIDLGKAIGLEGGTFYANAFQVHGRGLSESDLDNLMTVSSIEADRSTRLSELWYQQVLPGGNLDIRVGQLVAEEEFLTSDYGSLFINSAFGWPTLPAIDLPGGGPAYPLSTPGIRLRAHPSDASTVLVGVFNGSPAGLGPGDPQEIDASGTRFDLHSGVLVIGEVQFAAKFGTGDGALSGTYKLGGWYNSNRFQDQFAQAAGLSPSDTPSHRGDWSLYGMVDQQVSGPVGVFARAMGAPSGRNLVNVFVDGGVSYKGPFGRPDDTIGLGVGWAKISGQAQAGEQAALSLAGLSGPVQTAETVVELTYQAQLAPWWQVQPDVQYVIRPGGGLSSPQDPDRRVGNALVLGLRTVVTF